MNILMASSFASVLAIQQKPTKLNLEDRTFKYGNYENLTAILTDEQGNSLSSKKINFYVNNP